MGPDVVVRAYRDAVRVDGAPAPYDTIQLTVRHPALEASNDLERMSGALRADASRAPYPVVIVLPGVNVSSTGYTWLAQELVAAGSLVVTYDWVGELFPGQHGLTPGVDLAVASPSAHGSAPTTPALRPILDRLARMHQIGPLAGMFDLTRVALFGHSAGGTVALQSASPEWFPEVACVVTYGAHLMASQQLGFAAGTLLASPATVPVLLVSGDRDGVVAASAIRYGAEASGRGHDPVERTWREGLPHSRDAALAVVEGAGHLLAVTPEDPTSARGFLEAPLEADQDVLRSALVQLLRTYLAAVLHQLPAAQAELDHDFANPPHHFAALRRR